MKKNSFKIDKNSKDNSKKTLDKLSKEEQRISGEGIEGGGWEEVITGTRQSDKISK